MSTWNDVTAYIKTQLKPGVLGNTNVQKILNSVLAIVNQINAAEIDPENDYLWDAETSYPANTQPVIWQDQWLVSNIADNEGNVPISTAGVVHPTWRVVGSSAGSGIKEWEAIVYPNSLEIVFVDGGLYYLDRAVVGADPFVSVDFATELAAEQWEILVGGQGGIPSGGTAGQILTKNSGLDGDASWKDPVDGSGIEPSLVPFSTIINLDGNYKSVHSQTGPIAITKGAFPDPLINFENKTVQLIESNGTGGKPIFTADFVLQMDTWSNNTGDINQLIYKGSPSGKILVWMDNVELA